MTKFDKQFKMDAVQYYHDHRDLGLIGCAHNLGISQQTLSRWQKQLRDNGEMPYRGSGNYIMGPLSRPRSKILRVAVSRIILSSEASKVKLVGNLVA